MRYGSLVFTLLAALLLVASIAAGQTAPTAYELRIYAPAAMAPQSKTPIAVTEVQCNQTAPATAAAVNPTIAIWDDPANAGKVCVWTSSASGPLVSLPLGSYEGTIVAIDAAGAGAESNRAPFTRSPLQAARTGLRFMRQAP